MHDGDDPQLNEEGKQAWYVYLSEFKRDVYPTFKARGYSRDTALVVWTLQRLANQVTELREVWEEDTD